MWAGDEAYIRPICGVLVIIRHAHQKKITRLTSASASASSYAGYGCQACNYTKYGKYEVENRSCNLLHILLFRSKIHKSHSELIIEAINLIQVNRIVYHDRCTNNL